MKENLEAGELMIGNWVNYQNNPIKVLGMAPHCGDYSITVYSGWVYLKNCSGIILTPEIIIENCGFEKIINPPVGPIWDEDIEYNYEGYRFSQDVYGKWFLLGYSWNTKHFIYLHQLQNLYFALTGESLIINL